MVDSRFDSQNRVQAAETTLDLLDAVESGAPVSQRGLAEKLGVALGLTNALLKRCGRKGLLKFREAPGRRFAYYVTPKGFAEKSRLTAEYLSSSLHFFARARDEYAEAVDYCVNRGLKNIAFYGAGELSEIALLALNDAGLRPVAVIEPTRNVETFHGVPVARTIDEAQSIAAVDAIIITESRHPQATFDTLHKASNDLPIVTPRLLRVRRPIGAAE
jgi:DNA-binding MarR family transcriptional regulator